MKRKLVRKFRGIPVREARATLHVQPNKGDIERAIKESPEHCAYAECIRRTMDTVNVWVFKSVAYIQTLDEKGNPIMERYVLWREAATYLTNFDKGLPTHPGGFVFSKPSPSKTLDAKLERERERVRPNYARTGRTTKMKKVRLRTGTGRVHFIGAEDIVE